MRQTPSFSGARTCSRSSITMPSLVGLGFHPPPGWPKTLSFCLFVCLFVNLSRLRTSEFVRTMSPRRRWSAETILIPLDRERFVVVHLCSTFSDCCQLATPQNAEVQNMTRIGVFRRQRVIEQTDRDEFWHVSVYRWCAIAHQNWPSSDKGGRYRSPQECQNLPKIVVFGHRKPTQRTHSDEIWPVSVDY